MTKECAVRIFIKMASHFLYHCHPLPIHMTLLTFLQDQVRVKIGSEKIFHHFQSLLRTYRHEFLVEILSKNDF